ncbi:MAG: hypothetical protein K0S41_2931 [Anaerocolumna sp.]|nr:hypothetical protein [Anaerocolumna sp.]
MILIETNFIIIDGTQIAYTVCGSGDPIILIHGAGRNKEIWEKFGWVEALKEYFTVIAIDIRGYGESDKSYSPDFYHIDKILNDITSIIKANGFNEFYYFGHSYGATIGLQAIAKGLPIKKAVLASAAFGDQFFKVTVPIWIDEYTKMNDAKNKNEFHRLNLSNEDIEWMKENDLEVYLAQFKSWHTWTGVKMEQVNVPLAIYTGTNDNKDVLEGIKNNTGEMEHYHIKTMIFTGLNHAELVEKKDVCLNWILEFLDIKS